jgi:hypothetical protein
MKKAFLFLATCGLALLANAASAQVYLPPPPVSTSCAPEDYTCWAYTGYDRGVAYGANAGLEAYLAEAERASAYAEYWRAQPFSQHQNNMVLYWDYYLDGLPAGYYN